MQFHCILHFGGFISDLLSYQCVTDKIIRGRGPILFTQAAKKQKNKQKTRVFKNTILKGTEGICLQVLMYESWIAVV